MRQGNGRGLTSARNCKPVTGEHAQSARDISCVPLQRGTQVKTHILKAECDTFYSLTKRLSDTDVHTRQKKHQRRAPCIAKIPLHIPKKIKEEE